jgi:hypothetical protein
MLLKKIDVLRCTFMLVVVPPMLISSPAIAGLAVADGECVGWEESITVKSGKVISCGGWLFGNPEDNSSLKKCKGWKFTTSSRNVVKVVSTSKSSDVFYFCRSPRPSTANSDNSCGSNGWRKTPVIKAH